MDSATVSPSKQSRCSHGPVRNKSRRVSPSCPRIPVCIIHACSLYVAFKAGLTGLIRDCTRYRRPVTRSHTFSMDLARDPSNRSNPLCEGSREDHHALADCTLTFPISHYLETPLGRRRRTPTQVVNHLAGMIEVILKT